MFSASGGSKSAAVGAMLLAASSALCVSAAASNEASCREDDVPSGGSNMLQTKLDKEFPALGKTESLDDLAKVEEAEGSILRKYVSELENVTRGLAAFATHLESAAAAHAPALVQSSSQLSKRDLQRARQVVPGPPFLAAHAGLTNAILNKHLKRLARGQVKACEDMSAEELSHVMETLKARASPELRRIHLANKKEERGESWVDPRAGLDGMIIHEDVLVSLPHDIVHAKGCFDAAMSFTHAITDADKDTLLARDSFSVPLLPRETPEEMQERVLNLLAVSTRDSIGEAKLLATCAACHLGQ